MGGMNSKDSHFAFDNNYEGSSDEAEKFESSAEGSVSNSMDLQAKLKNLFGNTEKVSASAQKLFSMGKIYLTRRHTNNSTESDGFPALFQVLSQEDLDGCKGDNMVPVDRECHHPSSSREDSIEILTPKPRSESPVQQSGILSNIFLKKSEGITNGQIQTYCQWKAGHDLLKLNSFCFTSQKTLYLQPLNTFPDCCQSFRLSTQNLSLGFFEMLQGFMQIYFSGMEVMILTPISLHDGPLKIRSRVNEVTKQKQYCVNDIFPYLRSVMPRDGHSIIGITWTDLYPENFNFVLGEASYTHKSAVISFGRFETINFDVENHEDIFQIDGSLIWKLIRTLSHEVCHLYGLGHCFFFRCAMNESSSVDQALSQPLFLCPVCLRKLQTACGFEVLERYHMLLKFLQNINDQFSDCDQIHKSIEWLECCVKFLSSPRNT